MSERRIVVTGIGVVSPLGNNKDDFWKNLIAGKSGIRRIQSMDTTAYDCKIAGEVVDLAASKMAFTDSGLNPDSLDPWRVGVMVGSGIGGLSTIEAQYEILLTKGPCRVSAPS